MIRFTPFLTVVLACVMFAPNVRGQSTGPINVTIAADVPGVTPATGDAVWD
jgi:hypothetical protein